MRFKILMTVIMSLAYTGVCGFEYSGFIQGEVEGDQYGTSFCQLDFNGDGFLDLIISAPASDENGISSGKVYIYWGGVAADTISDMELLGPTSSFFGKSLSSAGDFNHDGFEDLLVGAPFYDQPAVSAGVAYLYYGGVSPNTTVDLIFTGENESDYFGIAIDGIGDFNGDGIDDIAIGAYRADWGTFSNSGKVYVYYGSVLPDNTIDDILVGSADGERFGYSIAGGDFDGNGICDIAVGAYSYDYGSFINAGSIYVFYGSNPPDSIYDVLVVGDSSGFKYGWALSSGDINGDSNEDLVMGSDTYPSDTFDAGGIFIYHGGISFDGISDDQYINDSQSHDYFGISVADGADYNRDGLDDICAGMPGYDNGTITDAGGCILFKGGTSISIDSIFGGDNASEETGQDILIWQANSDDSYIALGSPSYSSNRGRVILYKYSITNSSYICGDMNSSGSINLLDATFFISYLYKGGPAPQNQNACDVDSSGSLNLLDVTYLINYLYKGGAEPNCP